MAANYTIAAELTTTAAISVTVCLLSNVGTLPPHVHHAGSIPQHQPFTLFQPRPLTPERSFQLSSALLQSPALPLPLLRPLPLALQQTTLLMEEGLGTE